MKSKLVYGVDFYGAFCGFEPIPEDKREAWNVSEGAGNPTAIGLVAVYSKNDRIIFTYLVVLVVKDKDFDLLIRFNPDERARLEPWNSGYVIQATQNFLMPTMRLQATSQIVGKGLIEELFEGNMANHLNQAIDEEVGVRAT